MLDHYSSYKRLIIPYIAHSRAFCLSIVETDDGEVLTVKQVKKMQKYMAQLEEENQL